MKTIYEFKKGDKIVRVEAAKPHNNPFSTAPVRDRSYVGKQMIFMGIANGMIYLEPTDKFNIFINEGEYTELALDYWDEGWEYWVDPKTITTNQIPDSILKEKVKQALKEENYELLEKLKKTKIKRKKKLKSWVNFNQRKFLTTIQ